MKHISNTKIRSMINRHDLKMYACDKLYALYLKKSGSPEEYDVAQKQMDKLTRDHNLNLVMFKLLRGEFPHVITK